jgi:hypothetical protein
MAAAALAPADCCVQFAGSTSVAAAIADFSVRTTLCIPLISCEFRAFEHLHLHTRLDCKRAPQVACARVEALISHVLKYLRITLPGREAGIMKNWHHPLISH